MVAAPRIQPLRALRALAVLTRNPDDTAQVFTVIQALGGGTAARIRRRMARLPGGARLLRERPAIVPLLADRARLRALPEGSLGRAYLAFIEAEGISADGLVEASVDGRDPVELEPEVLYVAERLRDTHDLWHAVTGYQGDLVGESALLAFTAVQTRNPGIAVLAVLGVLRIRSRDARRVILGGLRRGLRAAWLPALDWERMLALPVAEVRAALGVGEPPAYAPMHTSTLRAMGALAPM